MWPQPFVQSGLRLLSCALCYLPSQSHLYFSPQQTVGQMVPRTLAGACRPCASSFSKTYIYFWKKIKYNGNQIWADLSCSCSPASPVAGSGQWVTWMHMHRHKPPPHCRSANFHFYISFTVTDAVPTTIHLFYFYRCNNGNMYTATLPTKILHFYCHYCCSHRVDAWLHFKKKKV